MPYDSMTGALNAASSSFISWGGREDEEERMKRSGFRSTTAWCSAHLPRIAWCMVGTAENQVGWKLSIHSKNLAHLNQVCRSRSRRRSGWPKVPP